MATVNKDFVVKNGVVAGSNVQGVQLVSTTSSLPPLTVTSSANVSNFSADLLDGQHGSYYLDFNNTTNAPDPVIGVNLTGDVTGAASATLTNLSNGQITIATTVSSGTTSWENITNKPDPIIGLSLLGNTTGAASVTLTDLTNGQISITTNTSFAQSASSIAGSLVTGTVNNASQANTASSINWSLITGIPTLVNNITAGSNGITIGGTTTNPTISLNSGASVSWGNISTKPSPIIGINLTGNTIGAASVTLSQLTNGQVSITTQNTFATSASSIDWTGVTTKPSPIIGVSLTGNTTGAASVTLTSLTSGQVTLTTNTAFAQTASSIGISGVTNLQSNLDSKAPLASASLTGIPIAPTAASGTNTQQIATTQFVRTEVANLISSAPATLDTLNELANALGNDPNFATSTASAIGQRLLASTASTLYMSIGSTANHANSASSINWTGITGRPTLITSVTGGSGITVGGTATDPTVSLNSGASVSWGNISSKPSPIIGVNLTGDVTGAASATLTQLANGQISIAATIAPDSIALGSDTTGSYVSLINGTSNQINVTGSGTENAIVTLSLPQNINSTATPSFAGVDLPEGRITSASATVSVNNTATTIDTFTTSAFTTAEYTIRARQGTKMTTEKVLVMWDGTDVSLSEYSIMDAATGAANVVLTATESSGTVTLSASSPDAASTNVIIKAVRIAVDA